MSKQLFTRPCTDSLLGIHGNALDVNTRFVNVSKSLALLSLKQSDPTVPEMAGWIPTLTEIRTLVLYHVLITHARRDQKLRAFALLTPPRL